MRVAVVGAGISGVACARVLVDAGHEVVVLERGQVPGGRMAARCFIPAGRWVDVGASYFTVREPAFQQVADDWAARGLARPWTDRLHVWEGGRLEAKTGPVRWAAAHGLGSLVADLARGLDVRPSRTVTRVSATAVDGVAFDVVVLAMPDPQALALLDPALTEERQALSGRSWEPVLVLAALWDERVWDWDGVFVHGSDVLEWVADDGSRRGDGAAVLTAHSTPAFAAGGFPVDALVASLATIGLPPPVEVQGVQRWACAKPVGTREAPFLLSSKGIGLCGDGWGSSRIEAAWLSGTALGHAVTAGAAGAAPASGGC